MSVQVKGSGTIGGLDEGLVVSGIVTSSTQINVGSNIKLGNAGVVTATSFVGDGSNLTGLTVPGGGTGLDLNDGVKLRLGTGNDIEFHHTSGGNIINYINGNLIIKKGSNSNSNSVQFDGNGHLYIPDDDAIYFGGSADLHLSHRSSDESGVIKANNSTGFLRILSGVSNSGGILLKNKDDDVTYLRAKNEQGVELYYANTKQCETSANGLTFPSGKGIDFSANTSEGGTSTATLLDDYEEGSYTITSNANLTLDNQRTGYYTKIGNMVNVIGYLSLNTNDGSPSVSGTNGIVLSLPYARNNSTAAYTGTMLQQNIDSDTPTSLVGHPLWYKVLPVDYVCMAASDGLRFYINKIEAAYTRMNNSHLHVGYPGYTYIVWNITYRTN